MAPHEAQRFSLVPPPPGATASATGIFLVNIRDTSEQGGGSLWHVPLSGGEISPYPLPPNNPVVAVGMVASKRTPLLVTVDGRSLILPDGPAAAPVTTIKAARPGVAGVSVIISHY